MIGAGMVRGGVIGDGMVGLSSGGDESPAAVDC